MFSCFFVCLIFLLRILNLKSHLSWSLWTGSVQGKIFNQSVWRTWGAFKHFLGMHLLYVFAQNFPIRELWQFFFSRVSYLFLPLVFICGTTGSLILEQATKLFCYLQSLRHPKYTPSLTASSQGRQKLISKVDQGSPFKGDGNGNPLQYSGLESPMDRGAWWAAIHGVTKSQTRLSDFTFTFHFHALEKEMAVHYSVLAWRVPGTAEPGGLPSMGATEGT